MGDASCAPRSPEELAAAVAGLNTLVAAGLLPPELAEKQREALAAEASAWARGLELSRSSVGEATGTSVTRPQPSVGSGPLPPAAPPPQSPAAKRSQPEVEHPESVQDAVKRLRTATGRTRGALAVVGCQSVLSMPGFTRTVKHRGEELAVAPPELRFFKKYRCRFQDLGCNFSSDYRGPCTMHEREGCSFKARAASTVNVAPEKGGESDASAGDTSDGSDSDEPHLEYGYLFNVEYKDKGYGDIEVSEIKAALAAASSVPSASAMPAPLAAVAARRGAAAPAAARQQTLLSWRPGPPPT